MDTVMRQQGHDTHDAGPPYRWNMKYYDWQNDYEIEDARRYVFGEWVRMKHQYPANSSRHTFDMLEDIIGREVEASFEGRSGGWFVIHSELTREEYDKITAHVEMAMNGSIRDFLKDERELRQQEAEEEAEAERERKRCTISDPRVGRILRQLHKHFPNDFKLIVHGVDVVKAYAELLTEPDKVL